MSSHVVFLFGFTLGLFTAGLFWFLSSMKEAHYRGQDDLEESMEDSNSPPWMP